MFGAHALLVTIIEVMSLTIKLVHVRLLNTDMPQLFFCYRVWVLSSCSWVAFPPALASLARGGITLTLSVLDMTIGIGIFRDKSSAALFYSALIISAMVSRHTSCPFVVVTVWQVDLYITVSLCTVLWNKRTGHRRWARTSAKSPVSDITQRTVKIVTAIICWTLGMYVSLLR